MPTRGPLSSLLTPPVSDRRMCHPPSTYGLMTGVGRRSWAAMDAVQSLQSVAPQSGK